MIALYILLLIGSFLMGRYDGGDMTYFVFVLFLEALAVMSKLPERKREKVSK